MKKFLLISMSLFSLLVFTSVEAQKKKQWRLLQLIVCLRTRLSKHKILDSLVPSEAEELPRRWVLIPMSIHFIWELRAVVFGKPQMLVVIGKIFLMDFWR